MVHSLLSFLSIFIFFTANLPILFHFRFAAANLRYCKVTGFWGFLAEDVEKKRNFALVKIPD
jgi:uncharacterized protein involved in cysteine biosynthesis